MCLEGRDKVIYKKYKDNRLKWETKKKENLKRKNW